ncbi:YugN-like family protein [Mesobacillus maritimus]|uniref:YugN-like family protein n=1 Tax=Mesobacillus maritimus TaxID=1643336 RepID=UPI0020404DC0|nr:YugN-like family protein [Mesobacillus maritimus]MCM3588440.1 YugN-like family protein [Mesobacillus maritimus]MCM3670211.1 YugN-like family protein [Mesobacillus maritimus]
MLEIPSSIEGQQQRLSDLEAKLKPMGFSIGGNWDYDHGSFDYKISDKDGYLFLRIPFYAVDGQLDDDVCSVEIQQPFLLSHIYEKGLDDHAHSEVFSGTFNQFSEPVEKDAEVPKQYVDVGKSLVKEVEAALSSST